MAKKPKAKPTRKATPKKPGPAPPVVDWGVVAGLARIQCRQTEIASVLGISVDALERACRRDNGEAWGEWYREKKEGGLTTLRRTQWQVAVEDRNATMLIWLGKQYAEQADKAQIDTSVKDDTRIAGVSRDDWKKQMLQKLLPARAAAKAGHTANGNGSGPVE